MNKIVPAYKPKNFIYNTQTATKGTGAEALLNVGIIADGELTLTDEEIYSVDGNVIVYADFKTMPVKFGVVTGSFFAYEGNLTTLENFPKNVGGICMVSENKLKDLRGAPRFVGGNFNCYGNKIETLAGAPARVGGNFYCHLNPLRSLAGFACAIGGDFFGPECLTDLAGAERLQDFEQEGTTTLRVSGAYIRALYQAQRERALIAETLPTRQAPNNRTFKI